jgi:glycosyltransferase involved in cell wall biosynthesis
MKLPETSKPSISVVIPAHNEEQTLRSCITSVQHQEIDLPYEIIVINNASTDKTDTEARQTGVKVIAEPRKGLYYARQAGLDNVESEYIMYVDADTKLPPTWMKKTIGYLQSHPDVVAVSGNYYFPDANLFFKPIHIFSQFVVAPLLLLFFRLFHKPDFLIGTAFVVRTKILKEIGGFSKEFPFYGEDMALAQRLSVKGKIRFFPTLTIHSSARRYNSLGLLKTHFLYYKIAFYVFFGSLKKAASLSKKYS